MDTPYRVRQMAMLFVAAQKPSSFTTDFHYASRPGIQWTIEHGVVVSSTRHGEIYKVYIALTDYDPCIYWDGFEWRRAQQLDFSLVQFPLGMDDRYRWLICSK